MVGKVDVFDNVQRLAESDCFELAIVLTPNHLHFSQAHCLLAAGKHVVIDKPFTCSLSEANRLIQLANDKQVVLSVFHNRRWDSDFLTVKKYLAGNHLGKLRYFESRFDKYRPKLFHRWREQDLPGAGLLFDIGSHLIDQALLLFGLPSRLYANIGIQREGAIVPDNYAIHLFYPDFEVVLRTSSLAVNTPFRFYLEGTEGSMELAVHAIQDKKLESHLAKREQRGADLPVAYEGNLYKPEGITEVLFEDGNYGKFYQGIYGSIRHQQQPSVTVQEAASVMKVIELAEQSARTGAPVDLI